MPAWRSRCSESCLKATRNGPTYLIFGSLGGVPEVMPIEPSPLKALTETSARLADLIERLVERLTLEVKIERGVGHLGAKLFAQVRDGVAGLPLDLLKRVGEPDPLGLDGDRAGPGLGFLLGFAQLARMRSRRSLRSLLETDAPSGKSGRILRAQLDQPPLGLVTRFRLGIIEPFDELQHPIAQSRVNGLLLGRDRPGEQDQEHRQALDHPTAVHDTPLVVFTHGVDSLVRSVTEPGAHRPSHQPGGCKTNVIARRIQLSETSGLVQCRRSFCAGGGERAVERVTKHLRRA